MKPNAAIKAGKCARRTGQAKKIASDPYLHTQDFKKDIQRG